MEIISSLLFLTGISAVFTVLIGGIFIVLNIVILWYVIKVLRLLAKFLAIKVKRGY